MELCEHPYWGIMSTVVDRVRTDSDALEHLLEFGGYRNKERKPDLFTWSNAAGNHAFDDYPEKYGITKHAGHCIRSMFQTKPETGESMLKELGAI